MKVWWGSMRGRAAVAALSLAVGACHREPVAPVQDAVPDAGPEDGACTPLPFSAGLELGGDQTSICDTDPAACASPCANGPLTETWSAFAVEPFVEDVQQINFGDSLVDDAGDVFFATCEARTAFGFRICGLSSLTAGGDLHSTVNVSGIFSDSGLKIQASLRYRQWIILALSGANLGGSVAIFAQSTEDPRQKWSLALPNAGVIRLHADLLHERIVGVINDANRGAVVIQLDPSNGLPVSRHPLGKLAIESVLDSEGNNYVALASADWQSGFGSVEVVALDAAGCVRWRNEQAWHGPRDASIRAVSGGLIVAFGNQVLRADSGDHLYDLPADLSSVVLGATDGIGLSGALSPNFNDEQTRAGNLSVFGFSRAAGQLQWRLDLPVGSVKSPPVLTSRDTFLFTTIEGAKQDVAMLREVTRGGRQLWQCALPIETRGGYLDGAAFSADRLLTANVTYVAGRNGPATVPGILVRAFDLGQPLAPASRGWVMSGGNPNRGGQPQP